MSAPTQWLLTYLLHSTVLLGAAALLCAALRDRKLALQEAVVRAALLGGFLTAGLQVGLGFEPVGGVVRIGRGPASIVAREAPASVVTSEAPASVVTSEAPASVVTSEAPGAAPVASTPATGAADRSVSGVDRTGPDVPTRAVLGGGGRPALDWRRALLVAWALAALAAFARLGIGAARLRRLLRFRVVLEDSAIAARARGIAASLGLRRPVPLHVVSRLRVPLATGVLRPGVFLPARALVELDEDAAAALCAHELAHVARRDPSWILLARVLEAALPVQPLHLWARRRLGEIAELLSDDLAVCASARPRRLARSLVDVASWTIDEPVFSPALASGALSTRSRLGHRVERLMDPQHTPERPPRHLLPLAAVAVCATALLTPVVADVAKASPRDAAPAPPARGSTTDDAAKAAEDEKAISAAREERQRELEALGESIAARAEAHSDELEQLEAEMESRREAIDGEEMARLEAEMESAVAVLVSAREDGESTEESRARVEDARQRLDAAREALRVAVGSIKLGAEEQKRIAEVARSVAESVRPTPEELARMRELSREIAEDLAVHREELEGLRELRHEWGESEARELRESLREMGESLRESLRTMPDVSEIVRSAHEAARAAEVSVREALEGLAEAEGTSRFDTPPAPPEAPEAPAPPEPASPLGPPAPPEPPAAPEPES